MKMSTIVAAVDAADVAAAVVPVAVVDVDDDESAAVAGPLVVAELDHSRLRFQNQSWHLPCARTREAEEQQQQPEPLQNPRQVWNGTLLQWFKYSARECADLLLPNSCGMAATDATVVVPEPERPVAGNAPPPIPPPTPNLTGGAESNEDTSEEAVTEFDAATGCADEVVLEFRDAIEDAATTTPLKNRFTHKMLKKTNTNLKPVLRCTALLTSLSNAPRLPVSLSPSA